MRAPQAAKKCLEPAHQTHTTVATQKWQSVPLQQHHPCQGQTHHHCQKWHHQCKACGNWFCPCTMRPTNHQDCPTRPQYGLPLGSRIQLDYKKLNRNKHVSFTKQNKVHLFDATSTPSIMLTQDSGANRHYISKHDQCKAGLLILRPCTWQVGVINGGSGNAKYVTQLPFCKLSARSRQAETFQDFPTSLMSMGKTLDDGTVSVFTKEGINVFKEEDVFITCNEEPILIGIRDYQGRYRLLLMQQRGHWQPRCPSKQARKALCHANSVYNLPLTKQAIKWMPVDCGYLVKLTRLKAIKARNYVGWPILTECNIQKYYPKTIKTTKGHLNQTWKNIRSTKGKAAPLETCNTSHLRSKKVHDMYTQTYMVRKTMFSNQTGQFPI
jgi:hypothetical protein